MPVLTTDFLSTIPIFRNMTEQERGQLLQIMQHEFYVADETVIRAGDINRGLHVIIEGEAIVALDIHGYDDLVLEGCPPAVIGHKDVATLGVGSVFGELSFFASAPHSASVQATTDLVVLTLRETDFHNLLGRGSVTAYKLALNAARILAERLRSADELIRELMLANRISSSRFEWYGQHAALHGGQLAQYYIG